MNMILLSQQPIWKQQALSPAGKQDICIGCLFQQLLFA